MVENGERVVFFLCLVSSGGCFHFLPALFWGRMCGWFHTRGTVGLGGIGQGWISFLLKVFTPYLRLNTMVFPVRVLYE